MSFDPDQLAASYNPDTDIEADPLAGKREEYREYKRDVMRKAQRRFQDRNPGYNKCQLHNQHREKYGLPPYTLDEYTQWRREAPKDSKGRVLASYTKQQLEKEYQKAYGVKR